MQRARAVSRVLAAAASLLAVVACGGPGEERILAQDPKKPFGAGSPDRANDALEKAVRAKLEGHAQLSGVTVAADVTRNQLTLSGTVASEALRERAAELAKSAQAGVVVNNRIRVRSKASRMPPMGKTGYA